MTPCPVSSVLNAESVVASLGSSQELSGNDLECGMALDTVDVSPAAEGAVSGWGSVKGKALRLATNAPRTAVIPPSRAPFQDRSVGRGWAGVREDALGAVRVNAFGKPLDPC